MWGRNHMVASQKSTVRSQRFLTCAAIGFAVFGSGVTFAQQLEEVTISAERRTESVQDVPISASVLTGKQLEQQGVTDIYDMQRAVPSLNVQQQGRSAFMNIRGIGTAAQLPVGVPGVAYYIDGEFIMHEFFATDSFFDMQAVEVLRGPQGTLTGQNSTGGAIFLRSTEPKYDAVAGYGQLEYGEYNRVRAEAALNVPLSGNAAVRFAGVSDKQDGYVDCILACRVPDLGSSDRQAFRANLQWEPTKSAKLNLRAEWFKNDAAQQAWQNIRYLPLGPRQESIDGATYINKKGWRVSGEAVVGLTDAIDLRTVVSFQDYTMDDSGDNDRTSEELPRTSTPPGGPTGASSIVVAHSTYGGVRQAEVNLISHGNSNLRWVLGAFYYKERGTLFYSTDNRAQYVWGEHGAAPAIIADIPVHSKSVFGQTDYKFADHWEMTFGLRYSKDTQDFIRYSVNGIPDVNSTAESSKTTGRAGLKYIASNHTMFYGTASRGYKGGGNNPFSFEGTFKPETLDEYELGMKSELLDSRLRLNVSAFSGHYTGLQLLTRADYQLPVGPGGALVPVGLPFIQNASDVNTKGLELDMTASLDKVRLNFGMAYLDNAFSKADTLYNGQALAYQVVPVGRTLPYSSKWQGNVGIERSTQVGSWQVTPRLQVSYLGDYTTDPFASFVVNPEVGLNNVIESHTLVDLRVAAVASNHWTLEGYVNNLFNKDWLSSKAIGSDPRTWGVEWAAPRVWGVRARYSF